MEMQVQGLAVAAELRDKNAGHVDAWTPFGEGIVVGADGVIAEFKSWDHKFEAGAEVFVGTSSQR